MVESSEEQMVDRARGRVALTSLAQSEPVVVCAYCDRIRTPLGEWRPSAPDLRPLLLQWPELLLSHGCCPDCLDRELAKCRVRVGPPGWRARRW